ncbi:NnrS family protein [Magnetospirillum sp. SS-4]|uniref:NnrS family protein n=1 Tax=Magnetospirillum sp. SS-4 TaxID=2681465 RepID=UPI00138398DB|nr:NnrS family protein [Magnetospirillum sp. SS-4]CAA7612255.1 conserved membrane hypothetical protein [Magnetospirillum sp. SS-4]
MPHDDDRARPSPPLWSSGFRPMFLVGCVWGVAVVALWLLDQHGGFANRLGRPLWHGHEMLYGFAGAISGGFILTALPSWAGTSAIAGSRLLLLLAVWGLGRLGLFLPPLPAAMLDLLYLPLLALMVTPGVWRASNRFYRLLPLILAAQVAGNLAFHNAILTEAPDQARLGLRLGLYGLMLLFSFVGGILTPIFTATAIGGDAVFRRWLEVAAPLALALLALADLGGLPHGAVAAIALAAALFQALRMAGWRGWAARGNPLLAAMHLGHAWLVAALVLKAAEAAGLGPAPSAMVHAFTLGCIGLTKLSLMTRVALKHTGRPLRVVPVMAWGFAAMGLAALARLGAELGLAPLALLPVSAGLWLLGLGVWLVLHAPMLARSSLGRS